MRPIAFWVLFTALSLGIVGAVLAAPFALGVPGEWEWDRVSVPESLGIALLLPALTGVVYVGFVWLGAARIDGSGTAKLTLWLAGLVVAGFAWLWIVQEAAPESYQLSKTAWVLYFRGSSGYFSEARDEPGDLGTYLANYEKKMGEGDVLHIGTHPPGLIAGFRMLLGLCRAVPVIADVASATEPESVRAAFAVLNQTSRHSRSLVSPVDRAVLWLAALVVQGSVALTIVPLYGLLRMFCSRRASWLAAAFWPAVPAVAVFCPKSDCLYPTLATGFLWLWLRGLTCRSWSLCALAGFVFWMGMSCSLAMLPVALIALVSAVCVVGAGPQTLGPAAGDGSEPRLAIPRLIQRILPEAAVAVGTFLLVCAIVHWVWKLNLPAVWRLNIQNHAGFYDANHRTYWKWLLVNPLEFTVAAGVPLSLLAGWSIFRDRGRLRRTACGITLGWLITIGSLWLSGKNMGEAARLWIFLMPFLIFGVGPLFESAGTRPGPGAVSGNLGTGFGWAIALALQLVTTMAIVTHIAGFHYPRFVPPA